MYVLFTLMRYPELFKLKPTTCADSAGCAQEDPNGCKQATSVHKPGSPTNRVLFTHETRVHVAQKLQNSALNLKP